MPEIQDFLGAYSLEELEKMSDNELQQALAPYIPKTRQGETNPDEILTLIECAKKVFKNE